MGGIGRIKDYVTASQKYAPMVFLYSASKYLGNRSGRSRPKKPQLIVDIFKKSLKTRRYFAFIGLSVYSKAKQLTPTSVASKAYRWAQV